MGIERGTIMKLQKVRIKKTTKCDTRAIVGNFTKQDVLDDTLKHKSAVIDACNAFAQGLIKQSNSHDYTKLGKYLSQFTKALKSGLKGDEFKKLKWWEIHKTKERHHLNDFCPDDVNLIDVIEMLADCVCAGKARTGSVYPINIDSEILQKAVANTVELFKESIELCQIRLEAIIKKGGTT